MRSRDHRPEGRADRPTVPTAPAPAPAAALLALQRTAGNHAIARWLQGARTLARVEDPLDPERSDEQVGPDPFYDDPQTAVVDDPERVTPGPVHATLPQEPPGGEPIEVPTGSVSFAYGFTPDLSGMQLGPQLTAELHPPDGAGPEWSVTAQLTAGQDQDGRSGYAVQSILAGPQAAWVWSFLNGAIQLSVLASALAGAVRTNVSGSFALRPGAQLSAGAQLLYEVDSAHHLSIGGQAARAWTTGGRLAGDWQNLIIFQWKTGL